MKTKIKNFLETKLSKRLIFGLAAFVILLFVFQAGIFVGYYKASHSIRFGDNNYSRAFGERNRDFPGGMGGYGMMDPGNAHGAAGKIVSVKLPSIIVADVDGTEKNVAVATSTDIKKFRETVAPKTLAVNDFIVVVGTPNRQGDIEARLIRVIPPPPMFKP